MQVTVFLPHSSCIKVKWSEVVEGDVNKSATTNKTKLPKLLSPLKSSGRYYRLRVCVCICVWVNECICISRCVSECGREEVVELGRFSTTFLIDDWTSESSSKHSSQTFPPITFFASFKQTARWGTSSLSLFPLNKLLWWHHSCHLDHSPRLLRFSSHNQVLA